MVANLRERRKKQKSEMIKEYKIKSLILKQKFKDHKKFKKQMLKYWEEGPDKAFKSRDDYYNDRVYKNDWPQAANWERPWIKYALSSIHQHLRIFAEHLGYQDIELQKLWYQQYGKQDLHNWHVHGGSYSGAYYVDFDKKCPTTEFLYPDDPKKSFTIDMEEGDMVFFPCFLMHRSATNQSKKRKSIISWNTDFYNIQKQYLDNRSKIDRLKK